MKIISRINPVVLGVLLSLLLFAVLIILDAYFPSISSTFGNYSRTIQTTLFTAAFCCIWIYVRWDLRQRGIFWAAISSFLAIHTASVILYSVFVRPISLWQWMILLYLESYIFSFVLEWSLQRFGSTRPIESQHR